MTFLLKVRYKLTNGNTVRQKWTVQSARSMTEAKAFLQSAITPFMAPDAYITVLSCLRLGGLCCLESEESPRANTKTDGAEPDT